MRIGYSRIEPRAFCIGLKNRWHTVMQSRWQFRMNASTSTGQNGGMLGETHSQSTGGGSQVLEYDLLPRSFTTLRKGGLDNQRCVDALVFQGGRRWQATGDNYVKGVFQ